MHCTNCGQPLPQGALVCPNCGAPVPSAAPPAQTFPPAPTGPGAFPPTPFATPQPGSNAMAIASLVLGLLAILAVVLAIVLSYSLGLRVIQQAGGEFTPADVERLMQDPAVRSTSLGTAAAMVFSQLLALIGLILGIVGVVQENKRPTRSGRSMGIIGIVLSILPLLCCVAMIMLYVAGVSR